MSLTILNLYSLYKPWFFFALEICVISNGTYVPLLCTRHYYSQCFININLFNLYNNLVTALRSEYDYFLHFIGKDWVKKSFRSLPMDMQNVMKTGFKLSWLQSPCSLPLYYFFSWLEMNILLISVFLNFMMIYPGVYLFAFIFLSTWKSISVR